MLGCKGGGPGESAHSSSASKARELLSSLEEACTSEDGQLDEERLLEKLLAGLHHRVSFENSRPSLYIGDYYYFFRFFT